MFKITISCCVIALVNRFVAEDRLPHLLLYGPPGTGKTTTILAVARQMYPKNSQFGAAVLEVKFLYHCIRLYNIIILEKMYFLIMHYLLTVYRQRV